MRRLICLAAAVLLVGGCADSAGEPDRSRPIGQRDLPSAVIAAPPAGAPTVLVLDDRRIPVDSVKTTTAGALLPPEDVTRIGWWVDSALPGSSAGTTVVAGHIDDVEQGPGAAARFAHLSVGQTVTLTGADGQQWRYRVDAVRSYDKRTALPVADLNRLDGPPTLALVTCGGAFVGGPLGYQDNDIVWASLV